MTYLVALVGALAHASGTVSDGHFMIIAGIVVLYLIRAGR